MEEILRLLQRQTMVVEWVLDNFQLFDQLENWIFVMKMAVDKVSGESLIVL